MSTKAYYAVQTILYDKRKLFIVMLVFCTYPLCRLQWELGLMYERWKANYKKELKEKEIRFYGRELTVKAELADDGDEEDDDDDDEEDKTPTTTKKGGAPPKKGGGR